MSHRSVLGVEVSGHALTQPLAKRRLGEVQCGQFWIQLVEIVQIDSTREGGLIAYLLGLAQQTKHVPQHRTLRVFLGGPLFCNRSINSGIRILRILIAVAAGKR